MSKNTKKKQQMVKKTGHQDYRLGYEDKFISVTDIPLIKTQHEQITRKFNHLSKAILRYTMLTNKPIPNEQAIMENYIRCYYEYFQFDQFDPDFTLLPSLEVNLYSVANQDALYKCYNIFDNKLWSIRFHSKFVAKMSSFKPNQIKYILSFIMLMAQGNFYGRKSMRDDKSTSVGSYGYVVPIQAKSISYNRFFYMPIYRQKNILFSVGVQKMPIIKNGTIKRYQFTNYIYILDVVSDQIIANPNKLNDAIGRYMQMIISDVSKKDHTDQLVIDQKLRNKKKVQEYFFEEIQNPYRDQIQVFVTHFDEQRQHLIRPIIFKPYYVSMADTSSLIFNRQLKRWVNNDYLSKMEQKALNEYQRKVNEQLIKRFVDFQSAKTLVQLLTKIPNFRVQLTEQQKDVIGENGNILVIGRSGTGKTTCAVLRLFAIQMLFKIRLSLSKKKHQAELKDTRCSADDIDNTMGLHCVFLTASPVLTNQIQRYYKKLTQNIKLELQKKRKKAKQERQKELQQQLKQSMKKKQQVPIQQAKSFKQQQQQQQHQIVQKDSQVKEQQQLQVPQTLPQKKSQQVLQQQQEMNKEFGSMKLQEKIQNQQFQEDQQNYDQMKDQLQEKMKRFRSLYDLKEEDYPGFFTVKSFIMMVDGTLEKPFFIRKSQQNQAESQATWHNEKKGVMMIQNYFRGQGQQQTAQNIQEQIEEQINYSDEQELEHEYLRQIQLRQNKKKQQLTLKLNKKKVSLSFQVDYDYFLTYFWPNVKHRHYSARNITPHLVWTQIFSTIKGSTNAHLYPGFNLTEKAYIAQSSNSFLTQNEKLDIFQTYCQYQRWKINNGGYDMMDAVNYILNYIRYKGYNGPQLHYIMIDQVQDLPHSVIYLLSKVIRYGVFYSGDTAQTIAQGVGFRFCDLRNLFDPKQFDISLSLKKPIVKQLTVNFRSHNNILQLANSVVSSIQILFPKTIDRLKKQVSNLSGPKPMILAEKDEQLLFYVLCGDQGYKRGPEGNGNGFKKPPLEFGCDQVIIVRDQQSKNKIPSMLQHALCLTIYQAKGLEFNDVILFNFFSQTKCAQKWSLLKFLKVVINEIDAQQYELNLTKHKKQSQQKQKQEQKQQKQGQTQKQKQQPQQIDVECSINRNENKVLVKKIVSDAKIIMKDINDYAELCSELKMLYTAITRPKNTLIIYDQDSTARKTIEKLWEKLEVVEMVSKELLEESNKKNKHQSQQLKIFKTIVNSTHPSQWKKQGMKMYSRGYFQQAMKCFSKSGHTEMYKKAQANHIADTATKKLIEIESQRSAITNKLIQYQKMSESELAKTKKKLKKEQAGMFLRFQEAGKIFESLLMFKQAGQCYFSGKKYQDAFENFSKAFMNKQAAQSLEMLNKYRQAADYYQKQGLYLKVIQCLDLINQWQLILKVIQKFSSSMTDLQKKSLFKKYSALALQELVYQIQFENEPDDHKPENNRVQIIQEQHDSQDQDWDSEQDPEIAAQRALSKKSSSIAVDRKLSNMEGVDQENIMRKVSVAESQPMRKQSEISQEKVIKESVYQNIQEKSVKKQQQIKKQEQEDSKANLSSFSDLNQSSQSNIRQQNSVVQPTNPLTDPTIQSIHQPNPNPNPPPQNPNTSNSSFADLNSQQSSFADLNEQSMQSALVSESYNSKYPSELEPDIASIKSMADPEDLWIQSALSEIQAKTNTQYSIIDQDQNYNSNVRIIKTKGNIVVQDQIMKKIIAIVSIVNESVEEFFKQFKGYQSLITISNDKDKSNEDIDNRPQISEFQDIDLKFVNIILDTLQSFKLYKLCLFVCNRYHLPHKAGRYLISMSLKYSTNAQTNTTLNPALIAPSISRKLELEKGILASIALHAIYENVSSDFLKVKVNQRDDKEGKNTLGAYFIQGLILQGLYKKAVFMVNPQQSLKILRNYSDAQTYQQVYTQKYLKKPIQSNESPNQFLSHAPKSDQEQQYTIIKLQSMMFKYWIANRVETISQRYYKEFGLMGQSKENNQGIPEYVGLMRALLSGDKNNIGDVVGKNIDKCLSHLQTGTNLQIFDTVCTLTTILHTPTLHPPIHNLPPSQFLTLLTCLRTIRKHLKKQHRPTSYPILQSLLAIYGCRMMDPCKSSKFVNDGYSLVYRGSIVCNQFVEELKRSKDETAFFFEQDFNYIVVRTVKLVEIVGRRFDMVYARFIRVRSQFKPTWFVEQGRKYLCSDFQDQQAQFLIKALLRQQLVSVLPKDKKSKKKVTMTSSTLTNNKKTALRPNFNYKMQGRPQLAVDMSQSQPQSEQQQRIRSQVQNLFIFPDLNKQFAPLADIAITAFDSRLNSNPGKFISGRLLYCAGINDTYKEYLVKRGGNNLYDAIQFRKFWRLDLYADNILSIFKDLSYTERLMFSAQILVHLMVQYKCIVNGKTFKLQIPRRFLKFFPKLTLLELTNPQTNQPEPIPHDFSVNEVIEHKARICAFSYQNHYSSELSKKQISQTICQFLELLKKEQCYKCYNIEKLLLVLVINLPNDEEVFESVRDFLQNWNLSLGNAVIGKLKGALNYADFVERKEKLLNDGTLHNLQMLHEIRVTDVSDLEKNIAQSQKDYQIKEKILQARTKAVIKIQTWWRSVKKLGRPSDQTQIIKQSRIIQITHKTKSLPLDDRFILRSSKIRNTLLSFYLRNIVTSSLDFHFILMTLNNIEELRRKYIRAFSEFVDIGDVEGSETDFEAQIANIESQIQIWKNDSKWLKDRNIELKRKKVFEIKWMTKSNINKVIKKRAGLQKQKRLEAKKKILKKNQF